MTSSSSDEEDLQALVHLENLQKIRRYAVHPVWQAGQEHRFYIQMENLIHYPDRFYDVYKMSPQCFNTIMSKVRDDLEKKCTHWKIPIPPEERLLITLRYFADGCSFKSISIYFLKGKSTVRSIVYETCQILWEKMQPEYMPRPNKEKWVENAHRYYTLWNLPNCVGSVDGKHIRIRKPSNSGSEYINYKGYFSIVLMAVVDADGLFSCIDVGELGRNSDGRAFQVSNFGQCLQSGQLDLPNPAPLPGETQNLPYYFLADEAFPLLKNIMTPYKRHELTNDKRIFNNRLSRGRKSVECAFGMTRTKFQALSTVVCCDPSKVDAIIQAMCILHNIVRKHDGKMSQPRFQNNLAGERLNEQLREETPKNIRQYLTSYFVKRAPIPYQNRHNV